MNKDEQDQKSLNTFVSFIGLSLLAIITVVFLFCLCGCQYLPNVADDITEIANNDAITIKCDKDCFQRETDVTVSVQIKNKEQK